MGFDVITQLKASTCKQGLEVPAHTKSSSGPVVHLCLPIETKHDEVSDDATSIGEITESDFSISSDEDSPQASFRSPSRFSTPVGSPGSRSASSPPDICCVKGDLDRWWRHDGVHSSKSGSIEMISLGPVTAQLSSDLQLYLQTGPAMEPAFVRAKCISIQQDGTVLVSTVLHGSRGLKHSATKTTTVDGKLEDLIVDVRVAVDDEPKMVSIFGAKLKKGCIVQMFAQSSTAEISCVVRYKQSYEVVALTQVVAELRELEVLRRDANLLLYQRQLNAMMIGKLRRQSLGLDSM
jgi:hypothetical protein